MVLNNKEREQITSLTELTGDSYTWYKEGKRARGFRHVAFSAGGQGYSLEVVREKPWPFRHLISFRDIRVRISEGEVDGKRRTYVYEKAMYDNPRGKFPTWEEAVAWVRKYYPNAEIKGDI